MKLARFLRYDLRQSLWRARIKLLPLLAFSMTSAVLCRQLIQQVKNEGFYVKASLGDYLFYQFYGEQFIDLNQMLPTAWFLMVVYLLFFTGGYPSEERRGHGVQVLVRAEKKWFWWLEKGAWLFLIVLFHFAVLAGTTVIYCYHEKISLTMELSERVLRYGYGLTDIDIVFFQEKLCGLLGCAVIAFYTLALIQQTLSLWCGARVAMFLTTVYLFWGVYSGERCFLGNFTMLMRYKYEGYLYGISMEHAMIYCGITVVLCLFLGACRLRRMDFIEKGSR